jgi:hypothetical protein
MLYFTLSTTTVLLHLIESIRIGFEYIGLRGSVNVDATSTPASASLLMIPLTLNYFVGSHNANAMMSSSKLELGAGFVYVKAGAAFGGASVSGSTLGSTVTIGYRFQSSDGGFVFRIGFTPLYAFSHLFSLPGLSLGYSF